MLTSRNLSKSDDVDAENARNLSKAEMLRWRQRFEKQILVYFAADQHTDARSKIGQSKL